MSSSNFYAYYIWLYVHCSALLWRRCDTLCTSGFVDDVIIAPLHIWARNKRRKKHILKVTCKVAANIYAIAAYTQTNPTWAAPERGRLRLALLLFHVAFTSTHPSFYRSRETEPSATTVRSECCWASSHRHPTM